MVYECEYIDGEVNLDPEEHDDFKWVTLEEMESLPKIAFLEELLKFLKN
jgi:NADH pyrophosphatase NudC (nudix superfamily)